MRLKFCAVFFIFLFSQVGLSYQFPNSSKVQMNEPINLLQKISEGVSSIASQTQGALVYISVSKTIKGTPFNMVDPFEFFFGVPQMPNQQRERDQKQEGLGSGFIVDLDKGYIMTNNHVIDDADEISLKLANGKIYDGKVLGRDKNTDVAVVKIKDDKFDKSGLMDLSFAADDKAKVGDFVIALGAPFGLEASISFGVVSALSRGSLGITKYGNFIQTDSAINPGNSGGPLLNTEGKVIGVNTAIFSKSGAYNGIGFAVPSSLAKKVGEKLVTDGKVSRGFIGAGLQPMSDEVGSHFNVAKNTKGVLIANIVKDGPADKSGLKTGDVVIGANDKPVSDPDELINFIGLAGPGAEVKLKILREGKEKFVTIKVGEWPEDEDVAFTSASREDDEAKGGGKKSVLGLSLSPLDTKLKKRFSKIESKSGLVVLNVEGDSPAARTGIRPGDLIISVNQKPVESLSEFEKNVKGSKSILIYLEREGQFFFVSLKK